MAALLTSETGNTGQGREVHQRVPRDGITVLPPNVHSSD
jgi:DNA polymerase III alpha subunit